MFSETVIAPAALAGDLTVTCVDESLLEIVAAVPPNETDEVLLKFVPVITTVVPPTVAPVVGDRLEIVVEQDVEKSEEGSVGTIFE